MKVFTNFAIYIQNLNKKDFEKYLIIFLVSTTVLFGSITYYIYSKSSDKVKQVKILGELTKKIAIVMGNYEKMLLEEQRLQQLLEQDKEFGMNKFFEKFCREQNLTPEPGFASITLPIEGSEFDEILLSVTFKGINTQILTKILDALDKKEIIYIKELIIKNEGNKKIEVNITLATKKYKKSL